MQRLTGAGPQTLVVRLEANIARRMRKFLSSEGHGYSSVSEFVEIAVLNQLTAEGAPSTIEGWLATGSGGAVDRSRGAYHTSRTIEDVLLRRPEASPPAALTQPVDVPAQPLTAFTNRLSPLKVALRVAAQLALQGAWPGKAEFYSYAAQSARRLGKLLRIQKDTSHYAVGYPIGDDAQKSIARYITSFTLTERNGHVSGPLAALGLATIADGRVILSRDGWRLAAAPSALLDGGGVGTLTPAEAKIFREVIARTAAEMEAVSDFLQAVSDTDGAQRSVDARLSDTHENWSREMLVAHRAAMVGRLAEAAVVEASGRGPSATIRLLPAAEQLMALDPGLPRQRGEVTNGESASAEILHT